MINKKKIIKMNKKALKNAPEFRHAARAVVDGFLVDTNGKPMAGDIRNNAIVGVAMDMSMGSNMTKVKYRAQGIIIGLELAALGIFIKKEINEYKEVH